MPTSSQRIISVHPQTIFLLKDNTVIANESIQPIKTIDSDQNIHSSSFSNKSTTTTTTKKNKGFFKNLEEFWNKKRWAKFLLIASLVLLTLLIMALVAVAITLPLVLKHNDLTTTTATTIITSTITTNISICISPYVQTSSGSCVNTLLDFNNCGAVGNTCPNNYTSCSAAVCSTVPVIQLLNYTSIWTGGINGSADDSVFNMTVPFPITLYNMTTTHVQITTNGVLCLSSCTNAWLDTGVPNNPFGTAVLPYWDDLYIYSKTWQGIYFATQGNAPTRTLTFEYYTSHYGSPNEFYHFQVVFFEAIPNTVQFIYFDIYDLCASCTVGVQDASHSQFIQYAFHQTNSIQPNMTLTFNTMLGLYTNSTIG